MNKILFAILSLVTLFCKISIAQDSILNKIILTKEFNLTENYLDYIISKPDISKKVLKEKLYEDCNIVIPFTDSSFKLNSATEKSILLYKNIRKITFRGESKFVPGLMTGLLVGAGAGLVITAIVWSNIKANTGSSGDAKLAAGIGAIVSAMIIIPSATFLGALTGGIIEALSYYEDDYNFSNFSKEKKKNEFVKLIKKNRISF